MGLGGIDFDWDLTKVKIDLDKDLTF